MVAPGGAVRVHTLPANDEKAFPENVCVDPLTGFFYTGSLINGTIYRGSLDSDAVEVFLDPSSSGLNSAAGIRVDDRGRLWIIDFRGRVLVYDTGKKMKLHTFVSEGKGVPIVNDLTLSRGFAYVTDSGRPFLYRIPVTAADAPGETMVQPWLTVDPPIFYAHYKVPFNINLNGIVSSPDGEVLLAIQSATGMLYRVDVGKVNAGEHEKAITRVEVSPKGREMPASANEASSKERETRALTAYAADDPCADLYRFVVHISLMNPLFCGDGLLLVDKYLYVARNTANEIVTLKLSDDYRSAELRSTTNDDVLAFPTGITRCGERLLVTNSQLNLSGKRFSGNLEKVKLPFTVVNFPLLRP